MFGPWTVYSSVITVAEFHSDAGEILNTVAAVFKVALQYSPRCNLARRQSEILAIEPALQYSPQPKAPLLMSITKDWCKMFQASASRGRRAA